jgi:hypothetical protein
MASVTPQFWDFAVLVSPADGMSAAVQKRDFGTSRWQLSDDITSPSACQEEGARLIGRVRYFDDEAPIGRRSDTRPKYQTGGAESSPG